MSIASIKVSTELRDRVSRLARLEGMTQGAYLDRLLRQAEEEEFWRRMATSDARGYQAAVAADGDRVNEDYSIEEATISDSER